MPPKDARTYHDPLHGAISLSGRDPVERALIQVIDTPAFQRLRRIRQLGPAYLTFHGAESSRFTHSLGVMAIARRALSSLVGRYPELEAHRAAVLGAALLHDLGHGPLSHTAEDIFGGRHEHWTSRILLESEPVRQALASYDPELPAAIQAIYTHTYPVPLASQLVSSQLDCDRLDYLMRDSYVTGMTYGRLDLDRILAALRFEPQSQSLVIAAKGQAAVEHYLIVRSLMYSQVYNHPKNLAATWGLEQLIRRARLLVYGLEGHDLFLDSTMTAWLTQDIDRLNLADYLAMDDTVLLYHLQRWQEQGDPILADLCRRFIERDLFKIYDLSGLSYEHTRALLGHLRNLLKDQGLEPDYYVGQVVARSRGYTLYQQGINVQTSTELREIGELSPLVQALVTPQQTLWLVYPRSLEGALQQTLKLLP